MIVIPLFFYKYYKLNLSFNYLSIISNALDTYYDVASIGNKNNQFIESIRSTLPFLNNTLIY
jgi:hypothetical protein